MKKLFLNAGRGRAIVLGGIVLMGLAVLTGCRKEESITYHDINRYFYYPSQAQSWEYIDINGDCQADLLLWIQGGGYDPSGAFWKYNFAGINGTEIGASVYAWERECESSSDSWVVPIEWAIAQPLFVGSEVNSDLNFTSDTVITTTGSVTYGSGSQCENYDYQIADSLVFIPVRVDGALGFVKLDVRKATVDEPFRVLQSGISNAGSFTIE